MNYDPEKELRAVNKTSTLIGEWKNNLNHKLADPKCTYTYTYTYQVPNFGHLTNLMNDLFAVVVMCANTVCKT